MRRFVIKTYFDLFNIVLKSFPKFYTVCIKCIEAKVLNLLQLVEGWRCRNGPNRLLPVGKFGLRQSFLALCRDTVHRLQAIARSRQGFSWSG